MNVTACIFFVTVIDRFVLRNKAVDIPVKAAFIGVQARLIRDVIGYDLENVFLVGYFTGVMVDAVRLNMALKQLDGDWLLVGGPIPVKRLFAHYRHRWSIETFFQSLKKRGFRLEDTHLKSLDRLKKLMAS